MTDIVALVLVLLLVVLWLTPRLCRWLGAWADRRYDLIVQTAERNADRRGL